MKRIHWFIALVLVLIVFPASAQPMSNDETEIRAIIEKYSLMWTTDNGLELFKGFSSDRFVFYGPNQVLTRNQFLAMLEQVLASNRPEKHIHTLRKLIIKGSIAFEHASLKMTMKDGTVSEQETINIFSKEATGWKAIANLPLVEIKEVLND